jgi:hypothetical protein
MGPGAFYYRRYYSSLTPCLLTEQGALSVGEWNAATLSGKMPSHFPIFLVQEGAYRLASAVLDYQES